MYHDEEFSEITMTEIQKKIISVILNDRKNWSHGLSGITSGRIEKLGINRKTFENNIDGLLKNYLIIVKAEEKHDKQIWVFYDITPLAVIVMLKNQYSQHVFGKLKEKSFEEFFPLLMRYWSEIKKIYGDEIYQFLDTAVRKITSFSGYYTKVVGKPSNEWYRHVEYHFSLNFLNYNTVFQRYFMIKKYDERLKQKKKMDNMEDIARFNNSISDELTFLFFFYQLQRESGITTGEGHLRVMNLFSREMYGIGKPDKYEKKLWKNNIDKISGSINIINSDENLKAMIGEKIFFINGQIKKPPVLSYLLKKIKF